VPPEAPSGPALARAVRPDVRLCRPRAAGIGADRGGTEAEVGVGAQKGQGTLREVGMSQVGPYGPTEQRRSGRAESCRSRFPQRRGDIQARVAGCSTEPGCQRARRSRRGPHCPTASAPEPSGEHTRPPGVAELGFRPQESLFVRGRLDVLGVHDPGYSLFGRRCCRRDHRAGHGENQVCTRAGTLWAAPQGPGL
jgi:hypothetical protein